MLATATYPEIPTSGRGSVGPRVSTTTKGPPLPSTTPLKTDVGLPKIGAGAIKPLGTKPIKTNVQVSGIPHDQVRAAVGQMPGPYGTAQAVVARELDPIVAQLIGGYTQQGQAGAAAINAVTQEYANQLAGIAPQVQGDYAGAEQGTAATNAALEQLVAGGGAADANGLAARLASIGSPDAVNPVVSQLAGQAQGAGTALYGTGSAALDALLSSGAAETNAALRLPGTAKEAGIQSIAQYLGSLSSAESKDLNTIAGKAPSLEQSAANAILGQHEKTAAINAENHRSAATIAAENTRNTASIASRTRIANNEQTTQRLKTTIATILATGIDAKTGLLTPTAVASLQKLGVDATPGSVAGSAGAGIVKANAALVEKRAQDTQRNNQAWARIQIEQTQANTAKGRLKLAQDKQAAATGAGGIKPLTAHEATELVDGWHKGSIRDVRIPAIDPTTHKQAVNINGVPQYVTVTKNVGQVGYVQAIQGLVGTGYPLPLAAKIVNGIYGDQMPAAIAEFAQTAVLHNLTIQQALTLAAAQQVFPMPLMTVALKNAYAVPTAVGNAGTNVTQGFGR